MISIKDLPHLRCPYSGREAMPRSYRSMRPEAMKESIDFDNQVEMKATDLMVEYSAPKCPAFYVPVQAIEETDSEFREAVGDLSDAFGVLLDHGMQAVSRTFRTRKGKRSYRDLD